MTGIFKINNNEIIDSAGKLTSAVFPAGHPVAEGFYNTSISNVAISAGGNAVILSVSCNFVSTSNKMLILASLGANQLGRSGHCNIVIQNGSSDLLTYTRGHRFSSGTSLSTVRTRQQIAIVEYLDVPSTGSVTINLRAYAVTDDFEFQNSSQRSSVYVQEIKS